MVTLLDPFTLMRGSLVGIYPWNSFISYLHPDAINSQLGIYSDDNYSLLSGNLDRFDNVNLADYHENNLQSIVTWGKKLLLNFNAQLLSLKVQLIASSRFHAFHCPCSRMIILSHLLGFLLGKLCSLCSFLCHYPYFTLDPWSSCKCLQYNAFYFMPNYEHMPHNYVRCFLTTDAHGTKRSPSYPTINLNQVEIYSN